MGIRQTDIVLLLSVQMYKPVSSFNPFLLYYLSPQVVLKMVNEIKKIPGISRVMFDLTSKPPGTTEWE